MNQACEAKKEENRIARTFWLGRKDLTEKFGVYYNGAPTPPEQIVSIGGQRLSTQGWDWIRVREILPETQSEHSKDKAERDHLELELATLLFKNQAQLEMITALRNQEDAHRKYSDRLREQLDDAKDALAFANRSLDSANAKLRELETKKSLINKVQSTRGSIILGLEVDITDVLTMLGGEEVVNQIDGLLNGLGKSKAKPEVTQ